MRYGSCRRFFRFFLRTYSTVYTDQNHTFIAIQVQILAPCFWKTIAMKKFYTKFKHLKKLYCKVTEVHKKVEKRCKKKLTKFCVTFGVKILASWSTDSFSKISCSSMFPLSGTGILARIRISKCSWKNFQYGSGFKTLAPTQISRRYFYIIFVSPKLVEVWKLR